MPAASLYALLLASLSLPFNSCYITVLQSVRTNRVPPCFTSFASQFGRICSASLLASSALHAPRSARFHCALKCATCWRLRCGSVAPCGPAAPLHCSETSAFELKQPSSASYGSLPSHFDYPLATIIVSRHQLEASPETGRRCVRHFTAAAIVGAHCYRPYPTAHGTGIRTTHSTRSTLGIQGEHRENGCGRTVRRFHTRTHADPIVPRPQVNMSGNIDDHYTITSEVLGRCVLEARAVKDRDGWPALHRERRECWPKRRERYGAATNTDRRALWCCGVE